MTNLNKKGAAAASNETSTENDVIHLDYSLKTMEERVALVDKIVSQTGLDSRFVEDALLRLYPHGAIGSFMTEYFEMAFKGRDEAAEFEKATVQLFHDVFGFESHHVGPIGLTPDVLLLSDSEGYAGIIDNKAYSKYTISNDHHNRMVHNYIEGFRNYCDSDKPLAFFSYVAGGFGTNIDGQLRRIVEENWGSRKCCCSVSCDSNG